MSRYGWRGSRDQLSPYSSSLGGGVPDVTDEDFSYITSEDLENSTSLDRAYQPRPRSAAPPLPEDDVLLIKNKGVTYPAHFPAYSIGDGKLCVRDVRDRVGMIMDLSDRRTRRVKMLYKGKILKEPAAPIRDYGVKNNSEVMVVLPELDPADLDDESSVSDEEMVVVGGSGRGSTAGLDGGKKRRKKKPKRKLTRPTDEYDSNSSPRDSSSNLGLPEQESGNRPGRKTRSPSPARPASAAIEKLNGISSHFTTQLLPLCVQFTAKPPTDSKKREDEHRKLSETVMQQVLLKLDEVETNGDDDARAQRKALVKQVQEVLKGLDSQLKR